VIAVVFTLWSTGYGRNAPIVRGPRHVGPTEARLLADEP